MKIIKVYKSLSAFLFYLTLIAIVAGINFSDGRSPGWFVQPLPVSDQFNDLFFIDTLHGWMVSDNNIIHSYNGGYNWVIQKTAQMYLKYVQFLDTNYGYAVGGSSTANIQKTTNGGLNWIDISSSFGNRFGINDLSFVNRDTGWVCIYDFFDGGVYRTINGGGSWTQQKFDQHAYDICFINKDTGWYCTNDIPGSLFRTTNGGINWTLQYTNSSSSALTNLFFINGNKGWIRAGGGNAIKYTTNGGYNWYNSSGPYLSGYNFSFINENTGYSGNYTMTISKTTNGGITWGYQNTPMPTNEQNSSTIRNDTLKAWASHLIHTTDGGGPLIYTGIIKGEHFIPAVELHQNYPNPFNPSTKIKFAVYRSSYVELIVYDINGREIETLLDNKLFNFPCIYEVDFDANEYNLSSGVYFYKIKTETENHKEIFIDTKKMLMIK